MRARGTAQPDVAGRNVEDGSRQCIIPLTLPAVTAEEPAPEFRIELQRGATAVKISLRTSAAGECSVWLRELLR